jgi:hypothetical protein
VDGKAKERPGGRSFVFLRDGWLFAGKVFTTEGTEGTEESNSFLILNRERTGDFTKD